MYSTLAAHQGLRTQLLAAQAPLVSRERPATGHMVWCQRYAASFRSFVLGKKKLRLLCFLLLCPLGVPVPIFLEKKSMEGRRNRPLSESEESNPDLCGEKV